MGTHPIFESDFDCLTDVEMGKSLSRLGSVLCGINRIVVNDGHYRHRRQLGEGAFSYVDLVERNKTGEQFALKRIVCHDRHSEKAGLLEAKVHDILTGPYLIKCIDHCVKKTAPYSEVWIVLPYYQNGTLWDRFQKMAATAQSFSEREILNLFRQITLGVKSIHDADYTHRDLKPANILLGENDQAVICDLGSSVKGAISVKSKRQAQSIQDEAAEKSTLPYRAPELFQVEIDDVINTKTDIWSLGCILYSLIYLEGPFDKFWLKGDSVHLAIQSLNFDKTRLASYSEGLRTLIDDCIYLDPEFRPNVDEVLERVEKLLQKE